MLDDFGYYSGEDEKVWVAEEVEAAEGDEEAD